MYGRQVWLGAVCTLCLFPLQLFDDLQERERNLASLESYATLLAKRLMEHAPPLLPSVDADHDINQ